MVLNYMTDSKDQNPSEVKDPSALESFRRDADKTERLKIPKEIPVLPIKDTVVFPNMVAALTVFTERDLKLLNQVLASNRFLALTAQKGKDLEVAKPSDLYDHATAAVVLQMLRMPDKSAKMLVQGISRIKIDEYTQTDPYFKAKVTVLRSEERR